LYKLKSVNATSLVKSQLGRQTVCCHFDVGDMVGRTGDASPVSPTVVTPLVVINQIASARHCISLPQFIILNCWRKTEMFC